MPLVTVVCPTCGYSCKVPASAAHTATHTNEDAHHHRRTVQMKTLDPKESLDEDWVSKR